MKLSGILLAVLTAPSCVAATGATAPSPAASSPVAAEAPQAARVPDDLFFKGDPASVLAGARALMEADENMALVTVDSEGQPRVRTVRAFLSDVDAADPRKGMTVWVMTRETTRKVDQVRNHPQVTLYFNDDSKNSYLSIMGSAILHTDPSDPGVRPFLGQGYEEFFWPEFPKGFVMLEVRPRWIEFMGPGIPNNRENWRPQAVAFPAQ